MDYKFKNYNDLKKEYSKAVDRFLGYHEVDSVDELPPVRSKQVKFLYKIAEKLDGGEFSAEKKAEIFSGAVFVIRKIIKDNFSYISRQSHLYNYLAKLLDIEVNTQIELEDEYKLASSAIEFIKELIYKDGEIKNGMKENHAFLEIGEEFIEIWKVCSGLENSAGVKALIKGFRKQHDAKNGKEPEDLEQKEAVEEVSKDQSNSAAKPGVNGLFNQGGKNSNSAHGNHTYGPGCVYSRK